MQFRYLNERLQLEVAEKEMIKKTNSLYQVYVPYSFLWYYFVECFYYTVDEFIMKY